MIGPTLDPKDLDCVVFYEAAPGSTPLAEELEAFLMACRERSLDMRAIAMDGDPILFVKSVSFFSTLLSVHRHSLEVVRGLVLVDCRRGPGERRSAV